MAKRQFPEELAFRRTVRGFIGTTKLTDEENPPFLKVPINHFRFSSSSIGSPVDLHLSVNYKIKRESDLIDDRFLPSPRFVLRLIVSEINFSLMPGKPFGLKVVDLNLPVFFMFKKIGCIGHVSQD